jgi:hypothetical protein
MSKIHPDERRAFLKGSAATLVGAACWRLEAEAMSFEDQPSVHGMLIVGEQTAYLSHLPMFGSPHDYQVILEVTFTKPGSNPQADYFNDRKSTHKKVYTLEPERFVLTRLAGTAPLRSFKANIYRGHFERFPSERAKESSRIAQDVNVNVTKVIHFRKFDPKAPKLSQLEYFLFGKGAELFLAHLITSPPDFDQVLSVNVLNRKFTDEELSKGVPIVLPGKTNSGLQRIRGVAAATGQLKGATGTAAAKTLKLQPGVELYFEQDELA